MLMIQDEKADEKPTGEANKTDSPTTPKRQKPTEPNSFTVKNMSRVTPSQFALLSFTQNERYEPVRPLGESLKEKKSAPFVCGNVVLLKDSKSDTPESEGKYIALNPALWMDAPAPVAVGATDANAGEEVQAGGATQTQTRADGDGDEEMAEPPAPFEYPFED